jgi:hypothetical protein
MQSFTACCPVPAEEEKKGARKTVPDVSENEQ